MGPLVGVFYMKQLLQRERHGRRQALGRLCLAVCAGGCVAKGASVPLLLMVANLMC